MRFFIAVEISEQVREQVTRRIELLRRSFPDLPVGWEKPEKLHLTLKFLGEVEEGKLPGIIEAIEKVARNVSPFELEVAGANVFPERGAARVLWLDVTRGKEILRKLNQLIEDECCALGFEREEHLYKPHLTIARLREPQRSQELAKLHIESQFPAIACTISEIVVFQSQQTPNGVVYRSFGRIALN
jgi:2'-5' RNA ligase